MASRRASRRSPSAGDRADDGRRRRPTLTPEYPGITDAGDVTSWDPPFPVDMSRVRQADEDYWDTWRGAPKAFIPLEVGQRLWPSPFGALSSLRRRRSDPAWPSAQRLDPFAAGLTVRDVRAEAVAAAGGTTDFGEYFVYFSFFLVVSGLLLAGMFFALSVEQRARELGVLQADRLPSRRPPAHAARRSARARGGRQRDRHRRRDRLCRGDHVRTAHLVGRRRRHDGVVAPRRSCVAARAEPAPHCWRRWSRCFCRSGACRRVPRGRCSPPASRVPRRRRASGGACPPAPPPPWRPSSRRCWSPPRCSGR